jgi:hypothetical protein
MPYASHPDFITPVDDTVLWRYSDFAKFMDFMERRKLWFSRADKFEDPLEGTFTDAETAYFRSLQFSASPEHRGWATAPSRIPQVARATTFVNCWREGKFESMAMWDIYRKGSGVVAIKSTVGLLKQAFATYKWNVYISRVNYINWSDAGGWNSNGLTLCGRKDISYSHESEVRAIIWGLEPPQGGGSSLVKLRGDYMTQTPAGQEVEVDPARLITEVIVGPREQTRIYDLVQLIMKRYGLPQPVRASDRLKGRI